MIELTVKSFLNLYDEREAFQLIKILKEYFQRNNSSELEIQSYLEMLLQGVPIQYVLEEAFFYDTYFKVSKDVLIPRPETEELVHHILNNHTNSNLDVIDIGTGSGCIPIVLKLKRNKWNIDALDISIDALNISLLNAEKHKVIINFINYNFIHKDFKFTKKYDLIISNPPYIPVSEKSLMHNNVLDYEPHLALFVEDSNPLVFYEQIAQKSYNALKENGRIYVEINEFFSKETLQIFRDYNYREVTLMKDLGGKERFVIAAL
jgi:release factor glutamine methyltransferase